MLGRAGKGDMFNAGDVIKGRYRAGSKNRFRLTLCLLFVLVALSPGGHMCTADANPKGVSNALINEKSPYLLQHAWNPVNWYPWGEEAF